MLHRIKRKSADDKEEDKRDAWSLIEPGPTIRDEPARSTISKNRQGSSVSQEVDLLRAENHELRASIADLDREMMQAE